MDRLHSQLVDQLVMNGVALHVVDPVLARQISEVFEVASTFFRQHLDVKIASQAELDCGYRPMGVEYSESPERPDQIESFSVTPRVPFNHLPDPAQLLYRRMLMAFDHCERLVNIVSTNIAVHVRNGLPAPCMEGEFRYWSRLQVNYSRPAEVTTPFINDAHEDGDFLTFACATAPGLEISLPSGEFVEPLNPPGTVLILPGEIVSLLSGGVIQPLYHRVRPNPMYSERLSLLFFADLNPRNCKAWVVNEKNAGVDIGARVLKSVARFGLRAFPPSTH